MTLLVQKFGGTSVGTLDCIRHVASRIKDTKNKGNSVVVIVSAMHGETDRLIHMAETLDQNPNPREFDALIATGEQVSMTLLAIALNNINCPAKSYSSLQSKILTTDRHTDAEIIKIETKKIKQDLANDFVVIIAGFQGINSQGDITTLGRGGSDTTAVAIATALSAHECQIYTDVDGVYTTDPRILPEASLLKHISYEEMLEMANLGAKVLQMRSVEFAYKHNLPIRVLSTFNNGPGTLVTSEEKVMKKHLVTGIAFSRNEAIISLSGVLNLPGVEGRILSAISDANIVIDMIAQNATDDATTDFTFTVKRKDHSKANEIIQQIAKELGEKTVVRSSTKVSKLSAVGTGMQSQAGVASAMFNALGDAGINIQMITTSEIKISVVIDEDMLELGVRTVHQTFGLSSKLAYQDKKLDFQKVN